MCHLCPRTPVTHVSGPYTQAGIQTFVKTLTISRTYDLALSRTVARLFNRIPLEPGILGSDASLSAVELKVRCYPITTQAVIRGDSKCSQEAIVFRCWQA